MLYTPKIEYLRGYYFIVKTKILIIRFSSIGDIVLTTPIIRCIKQQLDDVEVHFLTKEKHHELLLANPYIDKIHLLEENLQDVIPQLQHEKFDYLVDLHNNIRSHVVRQSLRVKCFTLNKLNLRKWLLVNLKIDLMPNVHIVDRMFRAIQPLGIKNDYFGLDYFVPESDVYPLVNLPEDHRQGYVAVVLAGTYFTKRLPAEKHIEILSKTDLPFVLLGGEGEKELAHEVEEALPDKAENLCCKLSINESASIIEQAKVVLANDTGLMHIAAAFEKKIVSVWGGTTPSLGMYPYLPDTNSKMQMVEGLRCQPCSKIGRHQCPKKHFRCMKEQDSAKIASWILLNY